MNEDRAEFRRVIIDLKPEILPELMETLGEFATRRSISVNINDSPAEVTEPSIETCEEPNYNPELITWVIDPESEKRIAIITESNLSNFAMRRNYSNGVGSRVHLALCRAAHAGAYGSDGTEDYMFKAQGMENGLLANKLAEFVDKLTTRKMIVHNIGDLSIRVLQAYNEALKLPEIE